jgi:hypothetical protein
VGVSAFYGLIKKSPFALVLALKGRFFHILSRFLTPKRNLPDWQRNSSDAQGVWAVFAKRLYLG